MADSEDDEDMRRAIALSLGVEDELPVVSKRPQQESLIDLTQDSDHENTARAVGGSLMAGDTIDGTPKSPKEPIGQGLDATSAEIPTKLLWGIAGLDRGQMERDRLARLKRKASISPPPLRKEPRLATEPNRGGSSASYSSFSTFAFDQKASEGGAGSATIKPNPTVPKLKESSSGASSKPSTAPGIQYPLGTVKKTWAFGHPRDEDVKIEEVLQRQDLKIAILSSFQWDVDWLVDKLDLRSTKLMLVMQAKDEATKTRYKTETAGVPNLRLCFPPMEGNVNCMHSKLQLLFHQDYLRIVVPTANLVPYDWGENGSFMENSIFMIDLPRLKAAEDELPAEQVHLTHFREELLYFLEAMKIPQDVQKGVLKFDFSKTSNIAFVHTIGGPHWAESWRRTGYCGLGAAVRRLGLSWNGPIDVDFVASSIGSLNEDLIKALFLAAQGDDGLTEYGWRTSHGPKSRRKDTSNSKTSRDSGAREEQVSKWISERFRIYFPSQETVERSKGGPMTGGTICLQSKWFNGPKFPRELFRDCKSRRARMLMHNKILFARPQADLQAQNGVVPRAWAYIGSANISESAWGRLVQDKTTKKPKLNCRNWECGVVIPTSSVADQSAQASVAAAVSMDVFQGSLPVPMDVPGEQYGSRIPWYNNEYHP